MGRFRPVPSCLGGLSSLSTCLPACVLSCPPITDGNGKNSLLTDCKRAFVLSCVRPFVRPCGAFIISLACVPCQDRDKGRKFSANFQIVEDGTHNRRKGLQSSIYLSAKKIPSVILGGVWCWVVFLLICEHCKRVSFAVGYCYNLVGVVFGYACGGWACNIIKLASVGGFCQGLAIKTGCGFHSVGVFGVVVSPVLFCGYFEDVPISAGRFRPSAGFLRPKYAASLRPCSLALFIRFLGFFS